MPQQQNEELVVTVAHSSSNHTCIFILCALPSHSLFAGILSPFFISFSNCRTFSLLFCLSPRLPCMYGHTPSSFPLFCSAHHPTLLTSVVVPWPHPLHLLRGYPDCHTRFYKENRMHLTCAPGSIYTHMIDKTSVIPLQ
jgi:hypothetical protein